MKILLLSLAAAVAVAALPIESSDAHGRGGRFGVSVGIGVPGYYRYGLGYGPGFGPGFYYGGYYRYYPRSYLGVTIAPRHRARRVRRAERVSVRQLYVYPAAGQSAEQLADDRYDCHVWASDAAGFDPTLGTGSRDEADDYARAFTACMEGRNYAVR
jgi:hypothetical protein